MRASGHEDDSLLLVDLIEETPSADAIAPRLRTVAPGLTNVRTDVGQPAQLGINLFKVIEPRSAQTPNTFKAATP